MTSTITIDYPISIPIIEVHVIVDVPRISISLVPNIISVTCWTKACLCSVIAILSNLFWSKAIAPCPTLKVNYSLVSSITIAFWIIETSRSPIKAHSSCLRNVIKLSLEISIWLFPWVDDVNWVRSTRRNPTNIWPSCNFSETGLAPTFTPRVLD